MMEYNCIIGIDPGANGGIAVNADGYYTTTKMPKPLSRLGEFLQHYRENYNPVVFIEKLAIRNDDLYGGKVFRIKSMIANYESLKAIIAICNVDYCEVHPLTWQSRLGLRIKGEEKPKRKARYKEAAQVLFPSLNVTMANCDALHIMRFGMELTKSTSRKDIKWLNEHMVINKPNADIYNNIYQI